MTNQALLEALDKAHLTQQAFARRVGVDPVTVSHWVRGRVPSPPNRWAAADVLGVDDHMLWPATVRRNIKVGPDREILQTWLHRADMPPDLWRQLLDHAERDVILAGGTNYFLFWQNAGFTNLLRAKAEAGCRVRVLLLEPDSDVVRARETVEATPVSVSARCRITLAEVAKLDGAVEARFSDELVPRSTWVFDDDVLVAEHWTAAVGHESVTQHWRAAGAGLVDLRRAAVEGQWERGRPVSPGAGG